MKVQFVSVVHFIENTETCYFVFGNKNKKTKNMLSDNRALVENNYHKYAVIMLVKTRAHITKKKITHGS